MRKRLLPIFLLFLANAAFCQSAFKNATSDALQRVVDDYRFHFHHICGEKLTESLASTGYHSIVQVPGVADCFVTTRNGSIDACEWRALVIESDDFNAAAIRYHELFTQVSNSVLRISGEHPVIVNGRFLAPQQHKKFNSIGFQFVPSIGELQKLHMDLNMERKDGKWVVFLVVHDNGPEASVTFVAN